jgi:hypothetical protein
MKNIDDIIGIIKSDYNVLCEKEVVFDMGWEDMIRLIYKDDRVSERSLLKKIGFNKNNPKKIHLIYIEVKDPKYRSKKDGRKLSRSMEDLKKKLRDKYGGKLTKNNPIHIVDEQSHSINLHNRLVEVGAC